MHLVVWLLLDSVVGILYIGGSYNVGTCVLCFIQRVRSIALLCTIVCSVFCLHSTDIVFF